MSHGEAALLAVDALRTGSVPAQTLDVAIVGAGPAGLAVAHAAWEAGLEFVLLERENLAASWKRYPGDMTLLSTRDETELPGFGLSTHKTYLSRQEAIDYFVAYARRLGLDRFVVPRITVEALGGAAGGFTLQGRHTESGEPRELQARVVVLATGAFAVPKPLGIPGGDLPFVRRWFGAGADHVGEDVVIVGGGNSALEAAIELADHGARSVTLLVRAPSLRFYRESGDLADVREGSEARLRSLLKEPTEATRFRIVYGANAVGVEKGAVAYETPGGPGRAKADYVYALTGYGFDEALLGRFGIPLGPEGPPLSPERETGRPGVYVAGAGRFIQHFRKDGGTIVADALVRHLPPRKGLRSG